MKDSKKSYSIVSTGTSSLLVIFVVLCLTVLAALSLSSAKADYDLSRKLADKELAYYTACAQAEEICAQLSEGRTPDADISVSGNIVHFEIPVDENRLLSVSLKTQGTSYDITEWKTVPADEWNGSDTYNLMQTE